MIDFGTLLDRSVGLRADRQVETLEQMARSVTDLVERDQTRLSCGAISGQVQVGSCGDRPKERFPEFDDPHEPVAQVFEPSGEIYPGHGSIELLAASVPYLGIAERLTQPPFPIDAATLDGVDEKERVRVEESRARRVAKRADQGPTYQVGVEAEQTSTDSRSTSACGPAVQSSVRR